ncbi:PEPxxWA-CTERM sorting domain-containing protein [Sphingomonas antarctica]|uniref:PEPxxWA-CTERM sorting domain-containing protein n=1 Tax=Sphingomonas antarctica TaxID=2040274 RepID=UPI0039EBF962
MKSFLLGAIAALAITGSANAAELLTNGSFESPNIGTGNYTYPAGTSGSWTYTGSALVNATGSNAWYGATPPAGQDGGQFAALQGLSTLSQSFVASNSKANVSWLAGGRPAFGANNGNQTYTVTVGANTLGTYSTVSSQAFGANGGILSGLTAGQTYTLSFNGQVAADETAFIDKVSVLGVPEPAQWALLIGGFGFVGIASRRRRSNVVFA